ncbi:peptidyl-prolyl cis-trans isomerase, putative [Candida dubliniensis CD36]|uniref:Serine/threonine-protein phosphatase 2A activator n=1 Tax=Candida dubliniensis (strain CD36 / ATCC MYA-646 / CBS 7987 / NCPF 3949 / NRRL Y-17841) TaxID=573826 RepID=B9WET4_CANDC|nr:peptidyl-prolyl cis-trans isomerase, putative [Candida dubliniensis CD36]CAX43196.1 peptidyl-prolyl cis-trans isomerase, putative [Candida dubliniensis CD36]
MNWTSPSKKIYDSADLKNFEKSIAFEKLQKTLQHIILLVENHKIPIGILNVDIVTRPGRIGSIALPSLIESSSSSSSSSSNNKNTSSSRNVEILIELFQYLNKIIDDTPPLEGPTRFGNLACRDWHDKIDVIPILKKLSYPDELVKDIDGFLLEANYYLINSFGSKIRLDYGTGHELSFLAFIGSLIEFKLLNDITGTEILVIFSHYYDLVRRLILIYNLEPAGSHGVWGLDDHFHLIYILGASQFVNDKLAPVVQRALSSQVINSCKLTNLYINAIAFIFRLKSGPFNEHSPIIFDIHNKVFSWTKVRQGLIKMYMVEVFNKFPVLQHFWCGQVLYPWKDHQGNDLPVNEKEETDKESDRVPEPISSPTKAPSSTSKIPFTPAPWANTTRAVPRNTRS